MSIHYASEELQRKFPDAGNLAFARRAEALLREERAADALRVLADGLEQHPGFITGFIVMARVYQEMGRLSEAREALEKALRLDNRCPAVRNMLAMIAETEHNSLECSRHLAVLIEQEPWDEEFRSANRRLVIPLEKPFGEENPPRKVRVDPFAEAPSIPKVEPSSARKKTDEFFEDDEIEEDGAVPNIATVTLAEIYFQQGLKDQAAQIYRRLLERQPDNETVKKRLEEIEFSIGGI